MQKTRLMVRRGDFTIFHQVRYSFPTDLHCKVFEHSACDIRTSPSSSSYLRDTGNLKRTLFSHCNNLSQKQWLFFRVTCSVELRRSEGQICLKGMYARNLHYFEVAQCWHLVACDPNSMPRGLSPIKSNKSAMRGFSLILNCAQTFNAQPNTSEFWH